MHSRVLLVIPFLVLGACGGGGGGGGGSSNPPPAAVAAPSGLSYSSSSSTPVFAVSKPITALTPTVTGTVTSYSVSPALPAGLTLNSTTGVISGTPTAGIAATTYTVTASNSGGSTSTTISFSVIDAAPSIGYGSTELKLVRDLAVTTISPQNSGGPVATWAIDNPLPAGLSFNTADGTISGTPTEMSAPASYTVTAENAVGTDSVALTIGVESGVLIDLGLGLVKTASYSDERVLDQEGDRVLGADGFGHWALWNAQTQVNLAQGETRCYGIYAESCNVKIDLAGPTFALWTRDGLELRDSSDGQLLGTIPRSSVTGWWQLATDGSYAAVSTATGLSVYSPSGDLLFSKAGSYNSAKVFAAPGELRLLNNSGGVQVLERISLPAGTSTTSSPLLGQAHSWFLDGEHFITSLSNTLWIYSADGVLADSQTLPHIERLTGQGNWFWTFRTNAGEGINIYEIDPSSTTPTINYPAFDGALNADMERVFASADAILVDFEGQAGLEVIDLSGAAPVKTTYSDPIRDLLAFAATSSTDWTVLNNDGVLADVTSGTPDYFSYGLVRDIGAGSDFIAVATAADKIFYFDAGTLQPAGTIDFRASKLQSSDDGTVIAAADLLGSSVTLKAFSLPSATEITSLATSGTTVLTDFALASSGQTFSTSRRTATSNQLARAVIALPGGSVLWSDTITVSNDELAGAEVAPVLSPSALSFAATDRGPVSQSTAWVYTNANLVGTAAGFPVGWLDEDRLFVNRYEPGFPGGYIEAVVVNAQGLPLNTPTLPRIRRFQVVSGDSIYAPEHNKIFSATTGATLWSSPSTFLTEHGGVTETHVVFNARAMVRAEPY